MRRLRPISRCSQGGFTLLELLISLALLALITTFIAGSLNFGRRAWERVDDNVGMDQLAAVRRFIERIVSDARQIEQLQANGRLQLAFRGEGQGLSLVATSLGYTERAGLYEYTFAVAPGTDNLPALYVTQSMYRASRPVPATAERRLLIDGIEAVELRYFGSGEREAPGWHPAWSNLRRLPVLVGITLKFPSGDRRQWPEQIVRVFAADAPTQ